MVTIEKQIKRNESLANDLKDFILKNGLGADVRIYFNNKCYAWDVGYYDKEPKFIDGIKPSQYFEYAEDDSVSMSFEGFLYNVLNYGESARLHNEFYHIFEDHKCYYELGHSWNLSVQWLED